MTETEVLKQQLVDCIRMLEQSDIIDYNGHASIRVGDDRMVINIGSCQRSALTIEDICTIDMEGSVLEGKRQATAGFHLHAGTTLARRT
jgi:L-fuculose-phosphate aldolase